ncbi:MAG TPA: nitrate/nitrite transporter NrtS [Dehalococcoidia bacterium]|nr:nitrate/nitrite transporter NrtS [Dehalococcoidia bacterium]
MRPWWLDYCLERDTILRSLKVALVVGTLLGVINHFPALLTFSVSPTEAAQIGLTYLVPFSVATYGQVSGKRQRDARGSD